MATRFNAQPKPRFNVPPLPTGYRTSPSTEFTIPPVGLQDVDRALFDLLNGGIPLTVGGEGTSSRAVPVIFSAGEKWALNKRLRALRDRNNALILPIISVVRTTVEQAADDITGRGINQQTGELVIHRRLDKSDRAYQGIINRLLLQHQTNVAVPTNAGDLGQLTTLRAVGDLAADPIVRQGGLLLPDRTRNIFETIVVPSPQFFTARYDVVLRTQYVEHMNQLVEMLMASFLPQGNAWRLETAKGYWFIASVDANQYEADNNVDDYAQAERTLRYRLSIKVPAYVLASKVPGAPVPVRRYVSSPEVAFSSEIVTRGSIDDTTVDEPFLGADDPTLPLDGDE